MLAQLAVGCLCASQAIAEPGAAAPESLELALRYQAPAGCPSSNEFLADLQQYLAAGGPERVAADVHIARMQPAGGFELRLRLWLDGKSVETRAQNGSCEDLMALAALNAGMARSRAPLADTPGSSAPVPDARGHGALNPAPERDRASGSALDREERWRTRSPHAFVLGEVRTNLGLLPRAAFGRGIGVGLALGPWSLRASGSWWSEQQAQFGGSDEPPLELGFREQSLELAPCAERVLFPRLSLGGCALIAGQRIAVNHEQSHLVPAVGMAALSIWRPWSGLRLEAQAGLQMVLGSPEFGVGALRHLHEPARFQALGRLGLGWDFGSAGAEPPPEPVRGQALGPAAGREGT